MQKLRSFTILISNKKIDTAMELRNKKVNSQILHIYIYIYSYEGLYLTIPYYGKIVVNTQCLIKF